MCRASVTLRERNCKARQRKFCGRGVAMQRLLCLSCEDSQFAMPAQRTMLSVGGEPLA